VTLGRTLGRFRVLYGPDGHDDDTATYALLELAHMALEGNRLGVAALLRTRVLLGPAGEDGRIPSETACSRICKALRLARDEADVVLDPAEVPLRAAGWLPGHELTQLICVMVTERLGRWEPEFAVRGYEIGETKQVLNQWGPDLWVRWEGHPSGSLWGRVVAASWRSRASLEERMGVDPDTNPLRLSREERIAQLVERLPDRSTTEDW